MPTYQNTTSATPNTVTRALVLPLPGGTVSITNGSTIVTGTGTSFVTWLNVGDDVIVSNQRRTIIAINSNTTLVVDTAFTTTANNQTLTYFPTSCKGTNKVLLVGGYSTNTSNIYLGESNNYPKNGADITAINRTNEISPATYIGPIVCNDLYNLYMLSSAANQRLIININT
jgi:hypothetical protein